LYKSQNVAESYSVAKLYTDPENLPQTQYDFVIVGAGTAGNVIATRLTEDPRFSVLVNRSGVQTDYKNHIQKHDDPIDEFLFSSPTLTPDTEITWNFTTAPQTGLNGRIIQYPRGRVLGGSSTVNYEVWTRGSQDDYDRFAQVSGDNGWSWNNMLPYMKKVTPGKMQYFYNWKVDPSAHGTNGPVQISLGSSPSEIAPRIINTTTELPGNFPFNLDMNSGNPLGAGWSQSSVDSFGRRSSSATAYLEPIIDRTNLDVLIQTQVTNCWDTGIQDGADCPVSNWSYTRLTTLSEGPRFIVNATKEVILSAGSIGTPQILQLSGIGDADMLVSITALVNLTDVGRNLIDHPILSNHWLVNSTSTTVETINRNATLAEELLQQWNATGTGQFSDTGVDQIATREHLPESNRSFCWSNFGDIEIVPITAILLYSLQDGFSDSVLSAPSTGFFLTLATVVVSPASREFRNMTNIDDNYPHTRLNTAGGTVSLASNNPFDSPIIDPGLLTDPLDLSTMITAVKTAFTLLTAPTWDDYVIAPYGDLGNATTDAELEAYARNFTSTIWHPVGTARMAANSTNEGVVDASLKVKNKQVFVWSMHRFSLSFLRHTRRLLFMHLQSEQLILSRQIGEDHNMQIESCWRRAPFNTVQDLTAPAWNDYVLAT
ncbi:Pyranose dehydrogenase, partial [Grifola frondosa]